MHSSNCVMHVLFPARGGSSWLTGKSAIWGGGESVGWALSHPALHTHIQHCIHGMRLLLDDTIYITGAIEISGTNLYRS